MRRRSQRGFSLLELMIVIAIIMILSAISIPNLLRARQNAYEVAATATLHTVQTEQLAYRASHGSYATSFSQLPQIVPDPGSAGSSGGTGGLPGGSGSGSFTSSSGGPSSTIIRQSYIFTLTTVNDEQWYCTASPVLDRYSGRYFYADETGTVRAVKGTTVIDSGYAQ